ncbi:hypothetical protein UFOVP1522_36 [uncultured Caudovirales phage]|uniref:Uncharacterized protein n=1 Tax=uncultured Caudovirales phage TaxID=2100421 RepID=A0A6J7XHP6_9CAUD|nr:hypothetical protein UFOVP989_51 [uncultured Caudovirales phage]CAB4181094.1 hypothetical protein UFOVP1075_15 [uncultured Caudovirales phage]CAB4198716.1 hypothetical protein UFOVP1312_7 [uncultured Caudovirales phage]CAB4210894.1 hypothetical protein UFOVP1426_51 [uncultured Caudovirales phage]CAB5227410.1 hypothetical protein UFOVP1522_36 [uncultured Caudovirales phage]
MGMPSSVQFSKDDIAKIKELVEWIKQQNGGFVSQRSAVMKAVNNLLRRIEDADSN